MIILCFTALLISTATSNIPERSENVTGTAESEPVSSDVAMYLSRFGYLPPMDPNSANLISESLVIRGIKSLQNFAGLEETGRIDQNTRKLLKTKRCGMPDVVFDGYESRLNGGIKKVINWTPDLGPGRVRRIVHESLKLWSDVSALRFQETLDPKADIQVEFVRGDHGDGYPFDGANVVLAHAFFPGRAIGGDAHFDDDESWTDQPIYGYSTTVNLYSVAAHEFGHSLGLAHSNDKRSIMYPYYRHTMRKTRLPYDDIAGIQALYGTGGNPRATKPEGYDTTPAPSTTTTPRPTTPTPTTTIGPPTPCDSNIGAISKIRNELFVFKGKWFWRFDEQGYLVEDSTQLSRFWYGFGENFTGPIDAVYERKRGFRDEIVFFTGEQYWVFEANKAKDGFPKSLRDLGLPNDVKRIDAAFIWKYNGRTYFFAGDRYWRFDEISHKVELTYPRKMSVWKGVPTSPDAVFTDHDGDTHFMKGDKVYKFNSFFMNVERNYPVPIREFWTHCSPALRRQPQTAYLRSGTAAFSTTIIPTLITLFHILLYYLL